MVGVEEDRTYKLCSDTTSEPGRYVKSLGEPVTGISHRLARCRPHGRWLEWPG